MRVFGHGANAVRALDGVSLSLAPATFTAVMGPSGSGKATVLLCAAGLEQPDGGSVRVGDAMLTGAYALRPRRCPQGGRLALPGQVIP